VTLILAFITRADLGTFHASGSASTSCTMDRRRYSARIEPRPPARLRAAPLQSGCPKFFGGLSPPHIVTAWTGPPAERIIPADRHAFALLTRAGITPPLIGRLNSADVDATLAKSDLTTLERMTVKSHLRNCALLVAGRPIVDVRR
jgi:hypothetical protein